MSSTEQEKLGKLNWIRISIWALLLGSAFFSCIDEVGKVYTSTQINTLLNAGKSKSWIRYSKTEDGKVINIDDCDEHQLLVFTKATILDAPNSLKYFNRAFSCEGGENMIVFLSAEYELLTSTEGVSVNQIVLSKSSDSSYSTIEILELTSVHLTLRHKLLGAEIIETFESIK